MLERLRRTAFPFGDGLITQVLQILDAHLARPESARRQIAETVKECGARSQCRNNFCRKSNVIKHASTLGVRAADEELIESLVAQMIDQSKAAAHRRLACGLIDHDEVHEFGHAGIAGASRTL